jgi:hypothetical protein
MPSLMAMRPRRQPASCRCGRAASPFPGRAAGSWGRSAAKPVDALVHRRLKREVVAVAVRWRAWGPDSHVAPGFSVPQIEARLDRTHDQHGVAVAPTPKLRLRPGGAASGALRGRRSPRAAARNAAAFSGSPPAARRSRQGGVRLPESDALVRRSTPPREEHAGHVGGDNRFTSAASPVSAARARARRRARLSVEYRVAAPCVAHRPYAAAICRSVARRCPANEQPVGRRRNSTDSVSVEPAIATERPGTPGVRKRGDQRRRCGRQRRQLKRRARHHGEAAERSAQELRQVVARDVLDDAASRLGDPSISQRNFDPDDEIPRGAEAMPTGTAVVGRDDAADGRAVRTGRIERQPRRSRRRTSLTASGSAPAETVATRSPAT